MPTFSILIITYNRCKDCLALLHNLSRQADLQAYVGEILLLNNHSSDSYVDIEIFIEQHPQLPVKYIFHKENLGVARGRNFLIEKAQFPYLLLLDDDVEFENNNALCKISNLFAKPQYIGNNTAIITLNIHYFDTKERQKNALPHKNYETYKNKEWFFTYYFTGAAHVMKKELFGKTGYYPEDFFYGMEEYDLSYRAIKAGYSLAYDSAVKVWHKESPLGRISNKEKMMMMWLNKSKVAWKYLPKKYFYSTALLWSFEYLKKTKVDIKGYFQTWKKIFTIPKTLPQQPIGKNALYYLKSVYARLWY
ncbi:MAG: glycosyltransferase family 2 protein [Chitinophagaceae bacterium]|jgi:GT2 family glycosyltransferase|nr:glycosyltransferase family 2 protein [Chitinophagaceae bacterium]